MSVFSPSKDDDGDSEEFVPERDFATDSALYAAYLDIPVFATWERVAYPSVKFVDLEDTKHTWVEAPRHLVSELEDMR